MRLSVSTMRHKSARLATLTVGVLAVAGSAAAATAPRPHTSERMAHVGYPGTGPQAIKRAGIKLVADGAPATLIDARLPGGHVRLARGFRDLPARDPASTTDRFRIGSVTKTFIAVAVLRLEQERKLDLDDTVAQWLPGLMPAGAAQRITLRMLLNHSSGLAEYMADGKVFRSYFATGDWNTYWSPKTLARRGLRMPPAFAPGSDVGYSNTNYVLAGMVIRKVTGLQPEQWVMRHLVRPLDLRRTSFPTRSARIGGTHLEGYLQNHYYPFEKVTALAPSWASTAGAMLSTTGDLAKFNAALWGGRLLGKRQMSELTKVVRSTSHPEYGSGLGYGIQKICGHEVWAKDGEYPGYFTKTLTSADGKRQLVYAVNSDSYMIKDKRAKRDQAALERAAFC